MASHLPFLLTSLRFGQRNLFDPSCARAKVSPELQPCNREPCPDRVHLVFGISQVTPLMSLEKNYLEKKRKEKNYLEKNYFVVFITRRLKVSLRDLF
jgi:hypothetical protein